MFLFMVLLNQIPIDNNLNHGEKWCEYNETHCWAQKPLGDYTHLIFEKYICAPNKRHYTIEVAH